MNPSSIVNLDFTSPVYLDVDEKYSEFVRLSSTLHQYDLARPLVTIVIPAYNDAKRLPVTLRKIQQFFNRYPVPIEVLCIVEKSRDDTLSLSRSAVEGDPRFQVIDNLLQRGKGYAVRSGMLRARGEIVFFTDADLSTPIYEVVNFLEYLAKNPHIDIVIGNRNGKYGRLTRKQRLLRQAMGVAFVKLVNLISGMNVEDSQAGFKAFRSSASKSIFSKASIDGFSFDVEVLLLANKLRYGVHSLPIDWINDTLTTVNPLTDAIQMLKDIFVAKKRVDEHFYGQKDI